MTHYLRYKGKTILDVEVTASDLSSVVVIETYSRLLLASPSAKREQVINDFHHLQELRGGWFEATPKPAETIDLFVETRLKVIAENWGLQYTTD